MSLNAWITTVITEWSDFEFQTLSRQETQELLDIVENTLGPKKAGIWWRTANPMLGDPDARVDSTGFVKLQDWLNQSNQELAPGLEPSHP